MQQPEGFHQGGSNMVLKLVKALYGLKQAPREWNRTIDAFLRQLGYNPLRSDTCVYIKHSQTNQLIILCLYVDDTVIAFAQVDRDEWMADKDRIAAQYAIKDLGECHWILNMAVKRDRTHRLLTLSQQAYIERSAKTFGVADSRTVSTPIDVSSLHVPP